jgi:hypothetical protein
MVQIQNTHNFEYPWESIQGTGRNTLRKLSWINGVRKYYIYLIGSEYIPMTKLCEGGYGPWE